MIEILIAVAIYASILIALCTSFDETLKELSRAKKRLHLSEKYIRRLKASAKMRGVDLEDVFDDRNTIN